MAISEAHKEKMRRGRQRAAAERKAAKPLEVKTDQAAASHPIHAELHGITQRECPIGCTAERCVITGEPICGHPCKGGIQPIHKLDQAIVERHNRARSHLAHVELSRRQGS